MSTARAGKFLAMLLAVCLLTVPASAAGTAEDSLVTQSYVDAWADELLSDAVDGIAPALAGVEASAGGRVYALAGGETLNLAAGASAVLVSGSANLRVDGGTVVDATVGARAVTGRVNAQQLYIAASSASMTAGGSARLVVWGSANVTKRTIVFSDVPEGSWYYSYVYSAVDVGFIDGVTETTFEPDSGFTVAQAIKIAACLHQLYHEGSVTLQNGETWYESYVSYAVENGICGVEYGAMGWSEMNSPIDRRDFAVIFYNAMPAYEYGAINSVGSIPDVPADSAGASEIYALYRAGVLDGALDDGSYLPNSGIRRSEAAAIVARMLDKSLRVEFTLE